MPAFDGMADRVADFSRTFLLQGSGGNNQAVVRSSMDFSKAFGCGRISPARLMSNNRTAEEDFMKGLKAVQQHGDSVNWTDVVKYYHRAANEVSKLAHHLPFESLHNS